MINFNSDYMEGAHPLILKRLSEINFDKNTGYGLDKYSLSAAEKIRKACDAPDAQIHFLVGGTQTNAIVIDSILRHNEGVIAAETGHINVHEAGAIEACGHRVMPIKGVEGKLSPESLEVFLKDFYSAEDGYEHIVVPKMVYISQPTEYGTIYFLQELNEIRRICNRYSLKLFIDGARMGYGLTAPGNDVTLVDIARISDVFYIGGTKVGAMLGEAVVITDKDIHITRGSIKNRGAMVAKGWIIGIQFDTLFSDGLYEKIAKNGVDQAMRLRRALIEKRLQTFYRLTDKSTFRNA